MQFESQNVSAVVNKLTLAEFRFKRKRKKGRKKGKRVLWFLLLLSWTKFKTWDRNPHDMSQPLKSHSARCDKVIKQTKKTNKAHSAHTPLHLHTLLLLSVVSVSHSHQRFYPCSLFLYKRRWENTSLLLLDFTRCQSNPTLGTF